jgi:WD40 repeat protein
MASTPPRSRSVPAGERLFFSEDHSDAVRAVAYSPSGALLASGDSSGRVIVRSSGTGEVRSRVAPQNRALSALGFSPDGARLFTVIYRDLRLLNPTTGAALGSLGVPKFGNAVYSTDGRHIVVSDDSRIVRLLDATTGALVRMFGEALPNDAHRQNLLTPSSVSFSPDGATLAVARWDQPIHIWETSSGRLVKTLPGLLHVAHSPDGSLLATGTGKISKRDTKLSIRIIDASTGDAVHALDGDPEARFSADGRKLFGLRDGELRMWDVQRSPRGSNAAPSRDVLRPLGGQQARRDGLERRLRPRVEHRPPMSPDSLLVSRSGSCWP